MRVFGSRRMALLAMGVRLTASACGGGRCLAVVVLLTAGCGGKSHPSDAAADRPGANCGGTIDVSGTSPEGPFTATSVYAEVSIHSSTCNQGLLFIAGDAATGSSFMFRLRVDSADGGAAVPLGTTSAAVAFARRSMIGRVAC